MKGWAWYKHNAELVEHTAALRDLKLLVGSGGLDFTKGMDSLDKHVKQISFRQCITFREHGQLKGWQPTSNPRMLKSQSCQSRQLLHIGFHWFAAVTCHNWEHNQYPVTQTLDTITVYHCIVRTNLGNHNSVTKPNCFSAWDRFSSATTNLGMMQKMDSLDKHVHHAEQISFRQCVTFCEHGQLKGWRQHFQPTEAKISISTILQYFVAFVAWKYGADSCKMPQQMALETTNQKV